MKRVLCVLLLLTLLCGCGRILPPEPPAYAVPLSGTVRVTTALTEWRGDWQYSADDLIFTLTAPPELAGITISCAEGCTMTKDGLCVPAAKGAPFVRLQKAWQSFLAQTASFNQTPEGWQYDLTATDGCTALQSLDGSAVQFTFSDKMKADFSVDLTPVE